MCANELELNHWGSRAPCHRCRCTTYNALQFTPNAEWKRQCYTFDDWFAPSAEFWNAPGAGFRYYTFDPAHTLDKGISPSMLGSLFKDVVYEKVLGPHGSLETQSQLLNSLIEDYYSRTGSQDRLAARLQLKDFVSTSAPHQEFPHLSVGNMSKVRRLVGFGVELAELVSTGSRRDQHRLQAFKALHRIYDIIYDSDDFLADTVVLELQSVIDKFLAHQIGCWLRQHLGMSSVTM